MHFLVHFENAISRTRRKSSNSKKMQIKKSCLDLVVNVQFGIGIWVVVKDKRTIILNAVPISLWPMLGKENRYIYTRHSNNNDRWF
jgi:hypothetical protein